MKICYVGNAKAFWCTEVHVTKSLEELGHEVVFIQEDEHTAEQVAQMVKEERPAFFLWTRTWGLRGDGFKMLREMECPSVAFHLDLYAGLARDGNINNEPWWKCAYVFSADGGSSAFFRSHGVNHIWSPPAVYGRECYVAEPNPELAQDVIFTGSRGYHPEWQYRPQLLDWLEKTYGSRFTLYEHNSKKRGHVLNELYASAKICVGDSLCLGFNHKLYHSDRVPETLGRGGFLIHPYIPGLEKLYRDKEHLVFYKYNDWDGLKRTIDYYLEHDDERETIRKRGQEWVKQHHTYRHRMTRVVCKVMGHTK